MTTPPWRMANGPAYNTVNVKRNLVKTTSYFKKATPSSTTTTTVLPVKSSVEQINKKTQFPDALKAYVARTFENCPLEQKPEVEKALKAIITDAFERNVVWETDWDNFPLPAAKEANGTPPDATTGISAMSLSNESKLMGVKVANEDVTGQKRKITRPWEKKNVLAKNEPERPDKKAKKDIIPNEGPDAFEKLNARYERYKNHFEAPTHTHNHNRSKSVTEDGVVIGRSTKLEKRYLRLTSAPDPDTVRPLHILKETLELLKVKWKTENNYSYICDQFKSLRQDLTVQHIKNEFTINVYEIHARIALEKGDLGEYNQCQTQLYSLYSEIPGGHCFEFKAYRILYYLHTCNRSDMNDVLANLTAAEKKDHAILHALAVRSAVASGDFHRFFRLLLDAPNMGGYLMDSFVPRERLSALCTICKAYRPDIALRHLTEELGFENDVECETFLVNYNVQHLLEKKPDGTLKLQTAQALPMLEAAKKITFGKVDIKGQI